MKLWARRNLDKNSFESKEQVSPHFCMFFIKAAPSGREEILVPKEDSCLLLVKVREAKKPSTGWHRRDLSVF
jgi:hypothetical protein